MNPLFVREELARFLKEDLGAAPFAASDGAEAVGEVAAEDEGVFCGGIFLAPTIDLLCEKGRSRVEFLLPEGARCGRGTVLARIHSEREALRHGIRTALNLMQHLSGVAAKTRRCVETVAGTGVRLLDTRKTTPGLRAFEKYAVRVGGGSNHRFGRGDGVIIKKEDIALDGGIVPAIDRAIAEKSHLVAIEVEAETLDDVRTVAEDGRVRHVLLDNMSDADIREAVRLFGAVLVLEASGNAEARLSELAATGVHCISTSGLIRGTTPLPMRFRIANPNS